MVHFSDLDASFRTLVITLHDTWWFIQSDQCRYSGNIGMYENKCFCEFMWTKVQLGENMNQI